MLDSPEGPRWCHGGAVGGFWRRWYDTGGSGGNPTMTRKWGVRPETHDDTGLVLNEKPMMTETPQTRKNFFLEKKVGPRKIFFGIFFLGGFGKPVSSWVLVESNPPCHMPSSTPPDPDSTPRRPPDLPPRVMEPPSSLPSRPPPTPREV